MCSKVRGIWILAPTTSQKIGRSFARSTSLKSAQNFVVIIRHSKPDNKLVDLLPGPRSSSYTNNLLYHLMLNTLYSDKITRGWKLHTICPVLQQVLMPLLPFLTIAKVLFSPTKSSIWYRALFSANYLIKQQFLKTRRQSSLQNTCIIWMTIHFTLHYFVVIHQFQQLIENTFDKLKATIF